MSASALAPSAESTPKSQPAGGAAKETRKHLRGSSLLLVGRVFSLMINLGTQLLLARYLTKEAFGAFSYALAAVALGGSAVALGLDKSSGRFVPLYHEQGDVRRMFGTMLLAIGTMIALGAILIAGMVGLQNVLAATLIPDHLTLTVTLLLIGLAPVEALDRLCMTLTASFAGVRAIFLRRHILGPGLKLAVVGLLVFGQHSVHLLALGFLLSGVLGTAFYYSYLFYTLRKLGLWQQLIKGGVSIPARDVLGYSLPLLTTDVANVARSFLAVSVLGFFHGPAMVAAFRVVVPIAGLNKVIFETFQLMYMPHASRLFARSDYSGIDHLYWRTALWITVLTYPVFLLTFACAEPFTVLMVGEKYREAGMVLAWLSLGFFLHAALGFNTLTLKVYGDVRCIVRNDLVAMAATIGLYILLVPSYGAVGAAIGNCLALAFHNAINQLTLLRKAGITFFPATYLRLYGLMTLLTISTVALQRLLDPPLYLGLLFCAVASLLVALAAKRHLEVEELFPELGRVPLVGRFFRFSGEVA